MPLTRPFSAAQSRRSSSVDAMQAVVTLVEASPQAVREAERGNWRRALWILRNTSHDAETLRRIDADVDMLAEQPSGNRLDALMQTMQRKALAHNSVSTPRDVPASPTP